MREPLVLVGPRYLVTMACISLFQRFDVYVLASVAAVAIHAVCARTVCALVDITIICVHDGTVAEHLCEMLVNVGKLKLTINATAMIEERNDAIVMQRCDDYLAFGSVLSAGVEFDGLGHLRCFSVSRFRCVCFSDSANRCQAISLNYFYML